MKFLRVLPEIMLVVIWIYILLPFSAPVAYKLGYDGWGDGVNRFYESFCHQRVERSLYLFGEDSFYTVDQLKEVDAIPLESSHSGWPEYFGHGYIGNDEIGYKVSICIRDIAMYGALALASTIVLVAMRRGRSRPKLNIPLGILFFTPMIVDGVFQSYAEIFLRDWISIDYVNNIPKRIITGALFGIGFGILAFGNLVEASKDLTNTEEK